MSLNIILADSEDSHANLLPLTYTRPVADLRIGILTIAEKWQRLLPGIYSFKTRDYLAEQFPCLADTESDETITIESDILPDAELAAAIAALKPGEALYDATDRIIAVRGAERNKTVTHIFIRRIVRLTDIFTFNGDEIAKDFRMMTEGRESQPVSGTVTVIGDRSLIFLEEGASVECCSLNTKNGPVYIGRNAEIMEGSNLRGPIAVCDHSTVNMGSKIYGATTVGPWSKVGGELNNVVIHSYSNKAHDGFLGNAVIGAWCNIGAGCVASNLKNDYTEIKLWNYPTHRFLRTGLQFCGLIMGDHSKAGINTMFNTATVVGVGVNIHGTGFPRNFVASFSEGGAAGFTDVPMSKFFDVASRVMARRGIALTDADRRMFEAIREIADNYK